MKKAAQEITKSIGWDSGLEGQLRKQLEGIKDAHLNLRKHYAAQGLDFNIDVPAALQDAAQSVVINSQREVSQAKRLDLIGISPVGIIAAYEELMKRLAELGLTASDIDERGEVNAERKRAILGQCEIVVAGEDAIGLANELEDLAAAVEKWYGVMKSRGQNTPPGIGLSMLSNGLLTVNYEGRVTLVPTGVRLYGRVPRSERV